MNSLESVQLMTFDMAAGQLTIVNKCSKSASFFGLPTSQSNQNS